MKKIISFTATISILFFLFSGFSLAGFWGHHKKIKASNGEIAIPIKKINDMKAHYFVYKNKGQEIKFFVVKSNDGVILAAFDACDVCFHAKKGYLQAGDFMICNNCARKFHSSRINIVKGGCNPAPLNRTQVGDKLIIREQDVLQGIHYFNS